MGPGAGLPEGRAAALSNNEAVLDAGAIRAAAERIRDHVHRTPTRYSRVFSRRSGANVHLKLENLQRTGSFKPRGALNRLLTLQPEQVRRGVVAASSGNHAQGVAYAASVLGVRATIVMPSVTPLAKISATRGYGARVILYGQIFDDAHRRALGMAERQGASYVHPFDDWEVMAGQGTIALEMLEDLPELEVLLVPVGGGGLISGIAIAARSLKPSIRVIGVQPEGTDAYARMRRGIQQDSVPFAASTIADAVSVKHPGERTLAVMDRYVDDVVSVTEDSISEAMVLLLEREKTVAEGAGALGLAALLSGQPSLRRRNVGVIISGGNVDLTLMDRVIQHGLTGAGRILVLTTAIPDRPGELHRLAQLLARQGVNILEVDHRRLGVRLPLDRVELSLTVETRDRAHGNRVLQALRAAGYSVRPMHDRWMEPPTPSS